MPGADDPQLAQHVLAVENRVRERIVDLVRRTRRECAEGREAVGLQDARARLIALGDVGPHGDRAVGRAGALVELRHDAQVEDQIGGGAEARHLLPAERQADRLGQRCGAAVDAHGVERLEDVERRPTHDLARHEAERRTAAALAQRDRSEAVERTKHHRCIGDHRAHAAQGRRRRFVRERVLELAHRPAAGARATRRTRVRCLVPHGPPLLMHCGHAAPHPSRAARLPLP